MSVAIAEERLSILCHDHFGDGRQSLPDRQNPPLRALGVEVAKDFRHVQIVSDVVEVGVFGRS